MPSANIVTTASKLCAFYRCLLDGGCRAACASRAAGRSATPRANQWEVDFTLGLPIRYGLGFMLGSRGVSLFGTDNESAFGHVGFSNIFSWADPERARSVAMCASGKPVLSLHAVRLLQWLMAIGRAFPKLESARD